MKEISRLRMKFICYNMLIVTAVIGITFCAVAFVMEKREIHTLCSKKRTVKK